MARGVVVFACGLGLLLGCDGELPRGDGGTRGEDAGRDARVFFSLPDGPLANVADLCALHELTPTSLAPPLLLILDRSRSMNTQVVGAPISRWMAVTQAIDEVLSKTPSASWGLKMFPTTEGCHVEADTEVPVAPGSWETVRTTIDTSLPNKGISGTPTAPAVTQATRYMRTIATTTTKYFVLATDGKPHCGEHPGTEAVAAVSSALAAGIHTFVIGIATAGTKADAVLGDLAVAGGEPRSGKRKYYPVEDKEDLIRTLEGISDQIRQCTFVLDQAPASPDRTVVMIDGKRIARDLKHLDGWDFGTDTKSVQLFGSTCRQVGSGQGKVRVLIGCPLRTIQ